MTTVRDSVLEIVDGPALPMTLAGEPLDLVRALRAARLCREAYGRYAQQVMGQPVRRWWDDAETGSRGFVTEMWAERWIVFTGTRRDLRDWLTNLRALRRPKEASRPEWGGVHRGFERAWDAARASVLRALDGSSDGKPLYIAGHSQGGAEAMLGAVDLAALGHRPRAVYTFGQPRVGNADFARHVEDTLRVFRFTHGRDPVPLVPLWHWGNRHAGMRIHLTRRGGLVTWGTIAAALMDRAWGTRVSTEEHDISAYIAKIERQFG